MIGFRGSGAPCAWLSRKSSRDQDKRCWKGYCDDGADATAWFDRADWVDEDPWPVGRDDFKNDLHAGWGQASLPLKCLSICRSLRMLRRKVGERVQRSASDEDVQFTTRRLERAVPLSAHAACE